MYYALIAIITINKRIFLSLLKLLRRGDVSDEILQSSTVTSFYDNIERTQHRPLKEATISIAVVIEHDDRAVGLSHAFNFTSDYISEALKDITVTFMRTRLFILKPHLVSSHRRKSISLGCAVHCTLCCARRIKDAAERRTAISSFTCH